MKSTYSTATEITESGKEDRM